jgi:hypothetical protein
MRMRCYTISGLLDRALDLLAQGFGLCILCPLRLQLLSRVNCSSPFDILLPCRPYCKVLACDHSDCEQSGGLTRLVALGILLQSAHEVVEVFLLFLTLLQGSSLEFRVISL